MNISCDTNAFVTEVMKKTKTKAHANGPAHFAHFESFTSVSIYLLSVI